MKPLTEEFCRAKWNLIIVPILFLNILINLGPVNHAFALERTWQEIKTTEDGKQFWDKNSIIKNKDGTIEVLSKFQPTQYKNRNIKTEYTYLMKIDCETKLFQDIMINNITQSEYTWKESNGDLLIDKVIQKSCAQNFS